MLISNIMPKIPNTKSQIQTNLKFQGRDSLHLFRQRPRSPLWDLAFGIWSLPFIVASLAATPETRGSEKFLSRAFHNPLSEDDLRPHKENSATLRAGDAEFS